MLPDFQNTVNGNLPTQAVENAKGRFSKIFNLQTLFQFIKVQGPLLIVAYLAGKYLPWWATAVIFVGLGAWLNRSPKTSFNHGMVSGSALWTGLAAAYNNANANAMSTAVGLVLGGGKFEITSAQLILVTGLIGGLLAGCGCWAGSFLGRAIRPGSPENSPTMADSLINDQSQS